MKNLISWYKKNASKTIDVREIGKCTVDSGQLIMVDPCYLKEWIADEPRWHEPARADELSYHHACMMSQGKVPGGQMGKGVAFATCGGDGTFPVFAEILPDGRFKSVTVQFVGDE